MQMLKSVFFSGKRTDNKEIVIGNLELIDLLESQDGQKTLVINDGQVRHIVDINTVNLKTKQYQ